MTRTVKLVALAVIALLGAALLYYIFIAGKSEAPTIHSAGTIEGTEVNLAPQVAGTIAQICCREGEPINKGQIAIQLENSDLKAAVEAAQAGVDQSQAAVHVAQSSIVYAQANSASATAEIRVAKANRAKAQAEMDDASKKFERSKALFEKGFISQDALDTSSTASAAAVADFDSAVAQLNDADSKQQAAMAQLKTARDQLNLAQASFKQAQANLAVSKARLAYTEIASPISGTVVFKALEVGETVNPGVTVLTVIDFSSLYARIDLDERLIDKIHIGSSATIATAGAPGKAISGKVTEIGQYAEFATQTDMTRGRQDVKTFRVKVAFQDPERLLKPGMTVNVDIARNPSS